MGKGGSAQTQTTIQDVPEWAKPYYTRLLSTTEKELYDTSGGEASLKPYTPYEGQRIAQAGDVGDIGAAQGIIRDVASTPTPGLGQAAGIASMLGAQAQQLGQQQPTEYSEFQFAQPRQFTGEEVQQYMSPYMQNVVQRQQQDAIRQFEQQRGGRAAQAVQAGAFGGSRQAVQEALASEALNRQLGDIQAQGLQSAYEQAGQRFESDRAIQAQQEAARAAEAARVQAATGAEGLQQRQFQLQAMGFSADRAQQIADLGERARAGDIQAAQLLEAQGLGQLSREQAGLDIAYQDFLRQQQYPFEQIGQFSAALRGLPVQGAGTTTTEVPYNPYQQALGTGIAALGLYKGYAG